MHVSPWLLLLLLPLHPTLSVLIERLPSFVKRIRSVPRFDPPRARIPSAFMRRRGEFIIVTMVFFKLPKQTVPWGPYGMNDYVPNFADYTNVVSDAVCYCPN
jgi:hypothetical protein